MTLPTDFLRRGSCKLSGAEIRLTGFFWTLLSDSDSISFPHTAGFELTTHLFDTKHFTALGIHVHVLELFKNCRDTKNTKVRIIATFEREEGKGYQGGICRRLLRWADVPLLNLDRKYTAAYCTYCLNCTWTLLSIYDTPHN